MPDDDAFTDAVRRFLIQDGERCPECSSDAIDVVEVDGEIGAAKCPDCDFQIMTEEGALLRQEELPERFVR